MGWVFLSVCPSVCHASTAASAKPYVQMKERKPAGAEIGSARELAALEISFYIK
jgi:hypothetical protein